MTRTIKHNIFYSHKPEVVWEYLTKPELIEQWLMKNDFQPQVGSEFQFKTKPLPNFEFDGIIYCKVLELIPCKKLSYSWKGGPREGVINMDSIVTFTLKEVDNGTELFLEHSGLIDNVNIYSAMSEGWLKNITRINELINTKVHASTSA
jgi:uncharacterized protein YndB with AHSA1/START domain